MVFVSPEYNVPLIKAIVEWVSAMSVGPETE